MSFQMEVLSVVGMVITAWLILRVTERHENKKKK
jgi:hypothetical protein